MKLSTWILVIAALAVALVVVFWDDPESRAPAARSLADIEPALNDWLAAGEIAFEIGNRHGRFKIEIHRDRSEWWLHDPEPSARADVDPATDARARDMGEPEAAPASIEVLGSLQTGLGIVHSIDPATVPDASELGFGIAARQLRILRHGKPIIVLRLGSELGFEPYVYARINGVDGIWKAPEVLADVLARDFEGLRSRQVMPVPSHRITSFDVETHAGEDGTATAWRIERVAGVWQLSRPRVAAVLPEAFREFVVYWPTLEVTGFVADEPADLAAFGLAEPRATVRITADTGTTIELRIGDDSPAGDPYLWREDWNAVVTVAPTALSTAARSLDTYLDRRVMPISVSRLQRIEIERPTGAGEKGHLILVRGGERDWRLLEPVDIAADVDEVNVFTDQLISFGFREEVDAERELDDITTRCRFLMADGKIAGFDINAPGPDGRALVRRVGYRGAGLVDVEDLAFLDIPYYKLRHHVITDIKPERLGGLRMSRGDEQSDIELRSDGWYRRDADSDREVRLETAFVSSLATQWTDLWAKEFIGTLDDPPEWLGEPVVRLTLELIGEPFEEGEVLARINLFWPDPGPDQPRRLPVAQLDDSDLLFHISATPVNKLKRACPFSLD